MLQEFNVKGKGRGIKATRYFRARSFLVEYRGELMDARKAKRREKQYKNVQHCYMFYFTHDGKNRW